MLFELDKMKNDDLNIYVIMHKQVDIDKYNLDSCYKSLLVGSYKFNEIDNKKILLDSLGDNISNKNENYCELTGLYWMWKNTSSKYIGLCHYRRFLLDNKLSILNKKSIFKILEKKDIILPLPAIANKSSVYDDYKAEHDISDMDKCREIINKIFPDYIREFDNVMNGKVYYPCNMFIASKECINSYCDWLFKIFNELEKVIELDKKSDYQKRVYGFLSERLFTVWIKKNNLKIYETFMLKTDASITEKIKFAVKVVLKKLHLLWVIK